MWLFTKYGFYSIVQKSHKNFKGPIHHVRARKKSDLQRLMKRAKIDAEILTSEVNDYKYRILVDQEKLAKIGAALFEDVDYPNFKDEIADTPHQRKRLDLYHDVWGIMSTL